MISWEFLKIIPSRIFSCWFGLFGIQALCGLQEKLNFYGFKGKLNPAIVGSAENASVEQGGYVAVYSFHVAMSAAGGLTN